MKAVKLLGNCKLEIRDVDKVKARKGWVVVKMRASAICGTDLHLFYEQPTPAVFTPGHEFMGEVVETASDTRIKPSQRVTVYAPIGCGACEFCQKGEITLCSEVGSLGITLDGGDAEFALVPESCCLPVPDDITDEAAVLVGDVIGVPWTQLRRVGAQIHEFVAVSGLGPLGLGAVIVAKYLGCRVIGVDIKPYRLELARRLGADIVMDARSPDLRQAVGEFTKGQNINVGVECAGKEESLSFLLDNAAKWGRICLVGENGKATIRPSCDFLRRNLTMIGSTYFTVAEYHNILRVLYAMPNVGEIVTHRFPLIEAALAFETFREGNTGKVLLLGY